MKFPKAVARTVDLSAFCIRWWRILLSGGARRTRARALLPAIVGDLPPIDGRLVIFAAADPSYLARFGDRFVGSVMATCPNVRLHLHCFDPDPAGSAQVNAWQKRWPGLVSRTEENLPGSFANSRDARIVYFQSARFVRLDAMVNRGHAVLALDIDCIVHRDLEVALASATDADIGLFLRPNQLDPAKRVLAACLYAAPTVPAREFLGRAADLIALHLVFGRACAKLDQIGLYWAYLRRSRALRVWSLPQSLADWDMQPGSAVWNAKGARKNNPTFEEASRAIGD